MMHKVAGGTINDKYQFTYVNEKLGCKFFIDHIFMSAEASLLSVNRLDSGSNLRDHRTIGYDINIADDCLTSTSSSSKSYNPKAKLFSRRWDKANLNN